MINLNGASTNTTATGTLTDGTNGQIKIFVHDNCTGQLVLNIVLTVTNWGSTATGTAKLQFNALGESVTCLSTRYVTINGMCNRK